MNRSTPTLGGARAWGRVAIALAFSAAIAIIPSAPASAVVYGEMSGTISVAGLGTASGGCASIYDLALTSIGSADCTGGSYDFPSLVPGQYYLFLGGYANGVNGYYPGVIDYPSATQITVTGGSNTVTNVTLGRAALISGTITVAGAGAAGGGCVEAFVNGEYADSDCSLVSGAYSIDHVAAATSVKLYFSAFVGAADVMGRGV